MAADSDGALTNRVVVQVTNVVAGTNADGEPTERLVVSKRTNVTTVSRRDTIASNLEHLLEDVDITKGNALEVTGGVNYLLRLKGEGAFPGEAGLRLVRARAQILTGDHRGALEDLRHALANQTTNMSADEIYGFMWQVHGELASRAYEAAQEGRRADSMSGEAWYSNYLDAIDNEPEYASLVGFYEGEGSRLRRAERHRRLSLLYLRMAHAHPYRESAAAYNRGCREYNLYRRDGNEERLEKAREAFRQAREASPGLLEAYLGEGIAAWLLGDREAARAAWEQALGRDPAFAEAYRYLGKYYWEEGKIEEAREHLKRHAFLAGEDVDAYVLLARFYIEERPVEDGKRKKAMLALRIARYWLEVYREPLVTRFSQENMRLGKLVEGLSKEELERRDIAITLETNERGSVVTNYEFLTEVDRADARHYYRVRDELRGMAAKAKEIRALEAEANLRYAEHLRSAGKRRESLRFLQKAVERDPEYEQYRRMFEE